MGSVSIDLQRKEREYHQMTLADVNVVKYLILFRSRLDAGYTARQHWDIMHAGDTYEFNQELIALYASLDELVERCQFKEKNRLLLQYISEGYTVSDILEVCSTFTSRSATYEMFDRIVGRIKLENDKKWTETMHKRHAHLGGKTMQKTKDMHEGGGHNETDSAERRNDAARHGTPLEGETCCGRRADGDVVEGD